MEKTSGYLKQSEVIMRGPSIKIEDIKNTVKLAIKAKLSSKENIDLKSLSIDSISKKINNNKITFDYSYWNQEGNVGRTGEIELQITPSSISLNIVKI